MAFLWRFDGRPWAQAPVTAVVAFLVMLAAGRSVADAALTGVVLALVVPACLLVWRAAHPEAFAGATPEAPTVPAPARPWLGYAVLGFGLLAIPLAFAGALSVQSAVVSGGLLVFLGGVAVWESRRRVTS